MTQDRPTASELVTAVREFLEHDVMGATEGRVQFHTRVAVNVLNIVARELEQGESHARDEHARLAALLGHDGTLAALNDELCAMIRGGVRPIDDAALRDHVRASLAEALAINNPKWTAPRSA
jgi:hypothetical protein